MRDFGIELSLAAAVLSSAVCGCSGSGKKSVAVTPAPAAADDESQAEYAEPQPPPQPATNEEKAKGSLEILFSSCSSGAFEKAAGYIVYRGSDKTREWKDTCTYAGEEEKKQVQSICARINEYLAGDSRYAFGEFSFEEESEGMWYVLEVEFTWPDKKESAVFAFLEIGGRFALGDID